MAPDVWGGRLIVMGAKSSITIVAVIPSLRSASVLTAPSMITMQSEASLKMTSPLSSLWKVILAVESSFTVTAVIVPLRVE